MLRLLDGLLTQVRGEGVIYLGKADSLGLCVCREQAGVAQLDCIQLLLFALGGCRGNRRMTRCFRLTRASFDLLFTQVSISGSLSSRLFLLHLRLALCLPGFSIGYDWCGFDLLGLPGFWLRLRLWCGFALFLLRLPNNGR